MIGSALTGNFAVAMVPTNVAQESWLSKDCEPKLEAHQP